MSNWRIPVSHGFYNLFGMEDQSLLKIDFPFLDFFTIISLLEKHISPIFCEKNWWLTRTPQIGGLRASPHACRELFGPNWSIREPWNKDVSNLYCSQWSLFGHLCSTFFPPTKLTIFSNISPSNATNKMHRKAARNTTQEALSEAFGGILPHFIRILCQNWAKFGTQELNSLPTFMLG